MGEKSYRILGMSDYFAYYEFPENFSIEAENPIQTLTKKIMAEVRDLTDKAAVDAIIETCREEGVTDLYLIDKTFILEAIREKLERDKHGSI